MKHKWFGLSAHAQGIVSGAVSALCLTSYFVLNKHVYNVYNPSAVEYALLFALCGGLFGFASLMHRMDRKMYEKAKRDFGKFWLLATISFLAMGLLVIGQRYTTSINVALLGTLTIVTTMFFSWLLLGEPPSKRQRLWLLVMFVGLYVGIVGLNTVHLNSGDLIVLSSILLFGLGNALAREVMHRQGSFVVPNVRLVLSGGMALVASIFLIRNIDLMVQILPWALVAGLFYWLTMKTFAVSVHLINANHAVVLNNGQVISTSLAGVIFLGENYTWEKFIGSAIVLASIYYIAWRGRSA